MDENFFTHNISSFGKLRLVLIEISFSIGGLHKSQGALKNPKNF